MLRALFSGIAGLRHYQARMDATTSDMTNVGAAAGDRWLATFKTSVAQMLPGEERSREPLDMRSDEQGGSDR